MSNILNEIVAKRLKDINEKGYSQGIQIPDERDVPLNHFGQDPFIIAEIKKKSPSKGILKESLDPVKQASIYYENGIRNVSILTEENYFAGSLNNLIEVKKKFPDLAVLRKDFLLDESDIDISYRAGADAVLLIASILTKEKIESMYNRAKALGMQALVEVHDSLDIKKVAELKPDLTGINSRDLKTFNIDKLIPVKLKKEIIWESSIVFESGIHKYSDAEFAFSAGFKAILVGESLVKDPNLISELKSALKNARNNNFWNKLYSTKKNKPLIKICGLSNLEDVNYCDKKGLDILGFILAESPRQIDFSFIKNLPETQALKAAVVLAKDLNINYIEDLRFLMEKSYIDVIQIHSKKKIENIHSFDGMDYYNALSVSSVQDLEILKTSLSPRTLIDAFQKDKYGGTGKVLDENIISNSKKHQALWLAGGLGPLNIKDIINRHNPELIDASSSLEKVPGEKDHSLIDKYFLEINNAKV